MRTIALPTLPRREGIKRISIGLMALSGLGATTTARAAAQGFSATGLNRIHPALQAQIDQNIFPGAVSLVAHRGKTVHLQSHDHLDAAKTRAMSANSIFRLASMTKPIVSTAAMMLVEQGKLRLNDPLVRWMPELKNLKVEASPGNDVDLVRPILVHDVMRHTAGFVYAGSTKSERNKKLYNDLNIEAREVDITADQMLKNPGEIPLAHQPGTFWEYSIAIDVLGLLLERVAGKPLDEIIKAMLLDPLNMRDTAWWVPPQKATRLAECLDSDPLKVEMLKSYRQSEDPKGKCYFKGGAGLVGTAADDLRFAQMMCNMGQLDGRRYLSHPKQWNSCCPTIPWAWVAAPSAPLDRAMVLASALAFAWTKAWAELRAARGTRCGPGPGAPAFGSTPKNSWWAF
ncbi:MAG: serine hydrolase domain-containing protein [Alphaproteobacteria bacterium]|nr:serine hydrolase domain-containing protein [Alphaproteobacteria bacterium]